MDYYRDPENSTSGNTSFTTARWKPDTSIIPIDNKVEQLTPQLTKYEQPATKKGVESSNLDYVNSVQPGGFSIFDQLNVLQALGNTSNDYYP